MSVQKSTNPNELPNWIDHHWTYGDRLHWMQVIMAFSPRDWSRYPHSEAGVDDPECWALYILVTCQDRQKALAMWHAFCFPELFKDE